MRLTEGSKGGKKRKGGDWRALLVVRPEIVMAVTVLYKERVDEDALR